MLTLPLSFTDRCLRIGFCTICTACLSIAVYSRFPLLQYDTCSRKSACCRHEVCAYNRICYPTVRCRYGCPDGECIFEEKTGYEYCWPFRPCNSSFECPPGNICSMHFNLGYNTCQYNLGIGSSLCYKKRNFWRYIMAQNKTDRIGMKNPTSNGQRKFKSNVIDE